MDQSQDELELMSKWFSEEGLASDLPTETRLCLLWRALQHTRSLLSRQTSHLDSQRSQHLAEMAEVRRSLEQIRIFTEHKDVLAHEIQDENDKLNNQLRRLISLQDSQISEVAKMLYQQGLTELIHSSPSEQVAYLLVERASLLDTSDPNNLTGDGNTDSPLLAEVTNTHQSAHKGVPHHSQSPWKRLFGHKATQSKHTLLPVETHQAVGVQRACSRLERDVEEGSRRLAMAHSEIRRLADELESAHLTRRAYEVELQAAEQEVEQLVKKVEKLKKFETVELQKAEELNERLDAEVAALRGRVGSLDAEKGSLQQTVEALQEKVEQFESAPRETQHVAQLDQEPELGQSKQTCRHLQEELSAQARILERKEEIVLVLQREVRRLELAVQDKQQREEKQHLAGHAQCYPANNLVKKHAPKQQLDNSHEDPDNLTASICINENNAQERRLWEQKVSQHCKSAHCQLKDSFATEDKDVQTELQLLQKEKDTLQKDGPGYQEAVRTLLATQGDCETLKQEICETLVCLDEERRKNHELKEKHKAKLCRAKERLDDETTWRDDRLRDLERELSLCSLSLTKEKELIISVTVQNDELLAERRRLLQQLNEEERIKKENNLRVDFLEMTNKKLENKLLHLSNQPSVLERSLKDKQSLHLAKELKKTYNPAQLFPSQPVATSSMMTPEPSDVQGCFDNNPSKQPDKTSSPHCFIFGPLSGSAENGYLNLTSTLNTQQLR